MPGRLIWIAPEERGGIRSYTEALWPEMKRGWTGEALDPVYELPNPLMLAGMRPDLIHVQHEFGLFGSKLPGFYQFPAWVSEVRRVLPQAKLIATAHTVLARDYVYPWRERGWQTPLRLFANQALLPFVRPYWREKTWGPLDGVVVHSRHQVEPVKQCGCERVEEIPHFVPSPRTVALEKSARPRILVFGFVTPEKGQDIVIRALSGMRNGAQLTLAGGARRREDLIYLERCRRLIRELGLGDRVTISGFVPDDAVDAQYARADLVIAPFRETSGSGSLAQALSRGAAVLASDLPLNREVAEREPGSLALFRSEDSNDCALQAEKLLSDLASLARLRAGALAYAENHSISRMIERHLAFYLSF